MLKSCGAALRDWPGQRDIYIPLAVCRHHYHLVFCTRYGADGGAATAETDVHVRDVTIKILVSSSRDTPLLR